MDIGKRIQKKRKAMGLSADQLAKMANCSLGSIRHFESGRLPERKNAGALARVKRILKVRVRGGAKPSKTGMKRGRKQAEPSALHAAIKALHLEVSFLSRTISKLAAKVAVPTKMIREAKVAPPLNGLTVDHIAPEAAPSLVTA